MKKIIVFLSLLLIMLIGFNLESQAETLPITTATTTPTLNPTPTPPPRTPDYGTYEYGDYTYKVLNQEGTNISIIRIKNVKNEIIIPSKLNNLNVVEIGIAIDPEEFEGNLSLFSSQEEKNRVTSIQLEEGITKIGSCTLAGLINLKEVQFPNSLKIIGYKAFYGDTSLKSIKLPNNCDLQEDCFSYCSSLTKVDFNTKQPYVDLTVFKSCNIKSIVIPQSTVYVDLSTGSSYDSFEKLIIQGNNTRIDVWLSDTNQKNLTIIAPQYSEAISFAIKYNFTYKKVVLPKKTTISKVKTVGNKKRIYWKKLSGISGYQVFYSKTKNGSYKKLTSTKKINYIASKKGCYKIRAYKTYLGINWYGSYISKKLT